jgi:hypothetical protein
MPTFREKFIEFADESAVGELLATTTYRIPVIDCTLPQAVSNRGTNRAYHEDLADATPGWRQVRTTGFSVEFFLGGAQVDTASGALQTLGLYKLLADALGGSDLTQVGGLAGAGASATSLPAATGTRVRGGISVVGVLGDGRAGGQAVVWGNPNTDSLVALPGVPNAGDVIRACKMAYLTDTPGPTKRFVVKHSEHADAGFAAHGCQAERVTITTNWGEEARVRIDYLAVNARQISGFTSALTVEQNDAAIAAAGSFHLQTVGTTTRNIVEARGALEITLNLGLIPITTLGGVDPYQSVTGWRRSKTADVIGTVRFIGAFGTTFPADWRLDGNSTVPKNLLAQLSTGEGTANTEGNHAVLFLPSLFPYGPEPMLDNWNEVPSQGVMYAMRSGPDKTNALTKSPLRIGLH